MISRCISRDVERAGLRVVTYKPHQSAFLIGKISGSTVGNDELERYLRRGKISPVLTNIIISLVLPLRNRFAMNGLIDIAWLYATHKTYYQPKGYTDQEKVTVLEITKQENEINIRIMENTYQEILQRSGTGGQCCLRQVTITRAWLQIDTDHEKIAWCNVSQETFTEILESQGLSSFYGQTKIDVAGIFTSKCDSDNIAKNGNKYFAFMHETLGGLWARYDRTSR
jgi:hypothetical protein